MDLPCDGDGLCMVCKTAPSAEETLCCKVCATPWHVPCLSEKRRPETLSDTANWDCPDCVPDDSLSDEEKARRRQELLTGKSEGKGEEETMTNSEVLAHMGQQISCSICMQLPERPVTTPCGHNFCLKCFQKMVAQGTRSCANCRAAIPTKMAKEPRINDALVSAIRAAKMCNYSSSGGPSKPAQYIHNQSRPDKPFLTDRAKKTGKANACSGKIFVTIPNDHFGPILAENDPSRERGVLVGDVYEDRMECRQWGAHFPHVAGIAGQSEVGAQSVALSGGYEDDEDHGEWFLYTGSGGRDLSGNKRTNKVQSFDQKFDKSNAALRVSCLKGHPIRVVRSHKEKRSSYAPGKGVRYDGIYRIEKCWRKGGKQGFKMCRYLFVRCDNEPAPWTTDTHGDRPRPLPEIKELKNATDVTTRKASASWDFDEEKGVWLWKKPPPESRLGSADDCDEEGNTRRVKRQKKLSGKEKLLKEFGCLICKKVMVQPLSTPCGHNFCKACLQGAFAGQSSMRQRTREGGRSLRATKNIMACPQCKADVSDFLADPQVNRELMSLIESIQRKIEEESAENGEEAEEPKAESADEVEAGESDADALSGEANESDSNPELAVEEACEVTVKEKTQDTVPSLEKKAMNAVVAEETADKENMDVNSGAVVEAKDKTQALEKKAINVAAEETLDKPATGRSTRAKSKMPAANETSAAADEGKRRSKRKATTEGVLSTSSDAGVKTRSKKGKRV